MAKRLNYEIGFIGDTSQLKQSINEVIVSLNKLNTTSSLSALDAGMNKASKDASELARMLEKATNVNTGKLDISRFQQQLHKSGKTLSDYATSLNKLGPQGQKAFLGMANAIASAESPLIRTNKLMNTLWVTMKNTLRWQLTSSALHGFMGALQTSYGYAQDLNKSLTNIRIVSKQSTEQMAKFAEQANKSARALSASTLAYSDAALIYYQQGR